MICNTKLINLWETSVSFFNFLNFLYCLGLRLPLSRDEPSGGGEGLKLCEAPSPPSAVSSLRPQNMGGYADEKIAFRL